MRQPNYAALSEALKIYTDVMRTLVRDRLKRAYPDNPTAWWDKGVDAAFEGQQQRDLRADLRQFRDRDPIEVLDPRRISDIIVHNLNIAFRDIFGTHRNCNDIFGPIYRRRNNWAHPPNGDFELPDVISSLRALEAVLEIAKLEEREDIRAILEQVIHNATSSEDIAQLGEKQDVKEINVSDSALIPVSSIIREPFIFRDGSNAHTPHDMLRAWLQSPDSGLHHLSEGHFESWFSYIGEPQLASAAQSGRKHLEHGGHLITQEEIEREIRPYRDRFGLVGNPFGITNSKGSIIIVVSNDNSESRKAVVIAKIITATDIQGNQHKSLITESVKAKPGFSDHYLIAIFSTLEPGSWSIQSNGILDPTERAVIVSAGKITIVGWYIP